MYEALGLEYWHKVYMKDNVDDTLVAMFVLENDAVVWAKAQTEGACSYYVAKGKELP